MRAIRVCAVDASMTLVVDVPPGQLAGRRYVLDVVLADWLGLDWRTCRCTTGATSGSALRAPPTGASCVPDVLFERPRAGLADRRRRCRRRRCPTTSRRGRPGRSTRPPAAGPLRRSAGHRPARGARARSALEVDVFGSAFAMLTRYEEAVLPERDRTTVPGRARRSRTGRASCTVPIVDAYVELLWAALHRLWPRLRRPRSRTTGCCCPTTSTTRSPPFGRGPADLARQLAGDVVRRRDPGLAARRARARLLGAAEHTSRSAQHVRPPAWT